MRLKKFTMVIASVVFTMLGVSIADISLVKAATTTNLEVFKENQSIDDKLRVKFYLWLKECIVRMLL